ncbi:hypothetical protein ANCCAN_11301 [Ancylostoma caninum]|uniref:Uncharacterized protein n=1 Tax=Ancylostoma caninum TaxID=29170 RepID=A0A368GEC2_ANCCA|nr:hypothetical protein ANCCAN_11301 [Ancylostoma caninum]
MWESTTDDEAPVANFTPDLDTKWPEPDEMDPPSPRRTQIPPPTHGRKSSCWSSPPNIYIDEQSVPPSPISQSECWSAPECLNNCDDSGGEEEEADGLQRACSCCEIDAGSRESTAYSGSYPLIDTAHQVPSLCSIRVPSSSDTSAASPSPPRPLSPVLGKPPTRAARISGSRSMQLRPRPEFSTFVDNSTSDDDSPQQDPWPQQEVWPEEDIMRRSLRTGWTANDTVTNVPRSHSSQMSASFGALPPQEHRQQDRITESRSMHTQLRFPARELESCSRPHLDEIERRDLITRSAWIDRGSTVHLQDQTEGQKTGGGDRCESQSCFRSEAVPNDHMRRSYTTEELKKERRRLPKRPDVEPFPSEFGAIRTFFKCTVHLVESAWNSSLF